MFVIREQIRRAPVSSLLLVYKNGKWGEKTIKIIS